MNSRLATAFQRILLVVAALPFLISLVVTFAPLERHWLWAIPAAWMVSLYFGGRSLKRLVEGVDDLVRAAPGDQQVKADRFPEELSELARSVEGLKLSLARLRNENLDVLSQMELISTLSAEFSSTRSLGQLSETLVKAVRDYFECSLVRVNFESGLPAVKAEPGYYAVPIGNRGVLELFFDDSRVLDSDAQRLLGTVARVADIAESNWRLFHQLTESKTFNETVLEAMEEGVVTLDATGAVTSANASARRMLGRALVGERMELCPEVTVGGRTLACEWTSPPSGNPATVLMLRDVSRVREFEQVRSDFTATLSHELRTPLTSMKGYLQTLMHRKAREFDYEKIQGILAIVNHQADRLNRLIMDLLEAARLRSGALEIHPHPTDLSAVLAQAIKEHRADIRLEAPEECRLRCDAEQIRYVLRHLLSNAVKYSVPGGKVEVRCELRGDCVHVSVHDEGVGIPLDQQERIFEMYTRVDTATTRTHYGVGLGLFLARRIVEAHGGEIGVASAPGRGSTFHFTLPLSVSLSQA